MRVIGGLGTIARIVSESEEIYEEPISLAAAMERIEQLYKPFHDTLAQLIDATVSRFGYAVLIDCHSMPSASVAYPAAARPDFVLGDRFGGSCDFRMTRCLRDRIAAMKFQVQLNRPYAGGFITEHYGRPEAGVHAIQIEINRGLYLNERTLQRGRRFNAFKSQLSRLVTHLASDLPALFEQRDAAE